MKNGGTKLFGYNIQMIESGVGKVSEGQEIQGFVSHGKDLGL